MGTRRRLWMPFWHPFSTVGNQIMENSSSCGLKLIFVLFYKTPPTRSPNQFGIGYSCPIGSIHRYHTVGGANCTTMVVMFVG